jgi:hypothetical protein
LPLDLWYQNCDGQPVSEDRPKGPSDHTLKHLAGMLPTFTKGVIERKATGKGRKVGTPNTVVQPTRMCPICLKAFDFFQVPEDSTLKAEHCVRCAALLKEGYIAFTSGKRFAFAKSSRMMDLAGKVVKLSPEVFEKLAQHYKDEWSVGEKPSQNP